jgi:hypothetical protein
LCWNLNALLLKIGAGNRRGITLSWLSAGVTAIAIHPPLIVARCCSFVSPDRATPAYAAHPSRDRDIDGGALRALAGSSGREEDRSTP